MARLALVVLLGLVLAWRPAPASAADRNCGELAAGGTIYVAFVLEHPPVSMGAPGLSPPGCPIASPDAQAFMPLIFLDDDER